eukprot:CAMPEP_0178403670 /NCGR_PEP_ID=MMETSP0689_2-20121128/17490_1 /TAXON_ID=160604 /ORGANISM="Amphidinium massartii, Strain CS-259" /LENGTH=810 /DNA_ID=CAMNT_0020024635 /DNA_START=87 /DNA_END=2519 /DNA_ORIENTATION=+
MKVLALILALASPVSAEASSTNPLQKTMSMLKDLVSKTMDEDAAAKKAYEELTVYCDKTAKNFQFEIKTEKAKISDLNAVIEKETSEGAALQAKVEELSGSISEAEAQLTDATGVRKKEAEDFAAESKELQETISMLERAIAILEREMSKGESSELQLERSRSLTQVFGALVQASAFSSADAARLTSFVQNANADSLDDEELGAPAAEAYKSHSSTIVETLEDLLDKAKKQLDDAQMEETKSRQNFEKLEQSLKDEMKYSTAEMDAAKKGQQECQEAKAAAAGDLERVSKELTEDKKGLTDLESDCVTKAKDYEEESASRKEELAALNKALEILSDTATGAASQTYELAQQAPAFVQVGRSQSRSAMTFRSQAKAHMRATSSSSIRVVRFVRHLAEHAGSKQMVLLAERLDSLVQAAATAGADPFGKVRGLIQDLIARLEKEASADAQHKAYCDKEMAETKEKKEEKTDEIEKLTTKIDSKTAEGAKLKEEVAAIQKELATLTLEQAEADKLRQEENELFLKNKPEMEAGIEGVKLALKVLREYYGSSEESESKGTSTGIIGMLEVVESDFTKGLAEMMAAEEAAAQVYDKETKENAIIKATKEQDVKYKTKQSVELDKAVAELTSDRASVQEELDAVSEALAKLEDMCIAKAEPYAERVARRAAEISGLKEALEILEGETAFVQRKSSRRKLRGASHSLEVPKFDKEAVEEDWHTEWRQGNPPSYEEIMKNKKESPQPEADVSDVDPKVPKEDGEHVFDKGGFKDDWHSEWRQGDFPSYKETYENGEAASQYEDRQSDGKPSAVGSGLP